MADLEKNIGKLLEENFETSPDCFNPNVRGSKIIHEPLYGTFEYKEQEIAVLDSFFGQRLKYIHQLGLSYQIFPGARHTRFEHTIGVVNTVAKFLRLLSKKHDYIKPSDINTIRLAGCLHDIGHGPFSHISENIMKLLPDMQKEMEKDLFSNCKPHEIISYYIIRSKIFNDFLNEIKDKCAVEFDIEEIPNYIIGISSDPENNQYKADLINGEFDSDKLDYIARDGFFSGIPISVDIDRFLFSTDIDITPDGNRKIVLDTKGIQSLQQLLFDKVMLNSTVYNHHKLKAIDQMIQLVFERIIEKNIKINGFEIKNASDLIRFDDHQILNLQTDDEITNTLISSLKNRKIFKKALVISPKTKECGTLNRFTKLEERLDEMITLRRELADNIGCCPYDIAIESPEQPRSREVGPEIIRFGPGDFRPAEDVFPYNGWLNVFKKHQWNGWVFASDNNREKTMEEAIYLFEEKFRITFNQEAIKQANID